MKRILLFAAMAASLSAHTQVSKVSLQASGLTCSMCSNAINKSLRTLDFVQGVDADIRTYTFEISFNQGAEVDFDLIKKKVEDAGFSITSFVATIQFENVPYTPGVPVAIANKSFVFTGFNGPSIDGVRNVRLLDRGFVSSKAYKKNHYPVLASHTYNASL